MNRKFRNTQLGVAIAASLCFAAPAGAVRVPRIELLRAMPVSGVVTQDTRPLAVEEVFAAIQTALERGGYSAVTKLSVEDVLFQSQILVAPGDAGLEVVRSEFDRGMKRGRFLLRASRNPSVLPFYAAMRLGGPSDSIVFPVANRMLHSPRSLPFTSRRAKPEILVAPGETATLVLHSDSLQLVADVLALERGAMGQQVRVRAVDTGKVFRARVDGQAHLDLKF